MVKWLLLLFGLLGIALLQTSAVPAFELFGVAPNLLLVGLVCWAAVRGQSETMILVPLAGIWIGLLSFQGMAVSVAAFLPIVVLMALRPWVRPHSEYVWALAVVILATVLHFSALAVSIEIEGSAINWAAASTDVLVPSILVNLIVGAVVYWLIRLPTPRVTARAV